MNKSKVHSDGGCSCGAVRYKLIAGPLVVHCCHCRRCQNQTGSAFALNALFDSSHIQILQGDVIEIVEETPSGQGQTIARCEKCKIALWSNYFMSGIKEKIRFLRVGTLDNPDRMPPDVHIFAASKQPWITLPADAKVYDIFYDYETMWTVENNQHRLSLLQASKAE